MIENVEVLDSPPLAIGAGFEYVLEYIKHQLFSLFQVLIQ